MRLTNRRCLLEIYKCLVLTVIAVLLAMQVVNGTDVSGSVVTVGDPVQVEGSVDVSGSTVSIER